MKLCRGCPVKDCGGPCAALEALRDTYRRMRAETRETTLARLRELLEVRDCEPDDGLRRMGEAIIRKVPGMEYIAENGVRVGYAQSLERKRDGGRAVLADCRKVGPSFAAWLPFDFVITVYEPNVAHLTDNQKKLVLLHELKHIGIGLKGPRIEEHDVLDFREILEKYGLGWSDYGADIPDILSG